MANVKVSVQIEIPAALAARLPEGPGGLLFALEGDAPPAGCIVGRVGPAVVLLTDPSEDDDGSERYDSWALVICL